jgi:hypothetical protein
MKHLILCPGDKPTPLEIASERKDVVDSLGTRHDTLYPDSASPECFYQISRKIGNATYPSGSETRYACRAWKEYGMVTESMWHTDKEGTHVWIWKDYPVVTVDGGVSQQEAAAFASVHRAEGYAMLGDSSGYSDYDEICDAIWEYGFVLAAIPIYENYWTMAGGDGSIPEPSGEIEGYHALCYYGYDDATGTIFLKHSWGTYCAINGSVSKHYTNYTALDSVYYVIMDTADVDIGKEIYKSLTVSTKDSITHAPIPAQLTVDGKVLGLSPQKFAVEQGNSYSIEAVMTGYKPTKTYVLYEGQEEEFIEMDPEPKPWWQRFLDWLFGLFGR